jgi:hypothetical protein
MVAKGTKMETQNIEERRDGNLNHLAYIKHGSAQSPSLSMDFF